MKIIRPSNRPIYVNLLLGSIALTRATPQDGKPTTGLEFASSCQSALWSWSSVSNAYASSRPMTTTFHSTVPITYIFTAMYQNDISAEFITLCDDHPRALGNATFNVKTTSYTTITESAVRTEPGTDFPEPSPCSIVPSDCVKLWDEFYQKHSISSRASIAHPPCATSGTSDPLTARSCTAPYLYGTEARLLYWPVQTVPGDNSFCNKTALSAPVLGGPLPPTISGTQTASGPNTFVIDGLTITSPSVGISLAGLKRADGCGTTVASTVILAPPDQISSARGVNAAYKALPFNFADLNWRCRSPANTSSFSLQFLAPTDNQPCYQDVAADAYFGGQQKWRAVYYLYNGVPNATKLVIANDYRPNVYPPQTFIETASRIWGPDVQWLVEGIWDPPKALVEQTTIEGVSLSGIMASGEGKTTGFGDEFTTPIETRPKSQDLASETGIVASLVTASMTTPMIVPSSATTSSTSSASTKLTSESDSRHFDSFRGGTLEVFCFVLVMTCLLLR